MRLWKQSARWITEILSSPVKAFIVFAAIFGLLVIFLAPPLTGADEEAHFVRAYGISEGDFRLYHTNQVSIPKSFRQTIGCFQTKTSAPGTMYQYRYNNYGIAKKASFKCALGLPLNTKDTELVPTTAENYSPTTYIPQVIAILLGRAVGTPIVVMVYMVRLSVVIAYIVMIALAIKILPVRKWALAGVALLPVPIEYLTNPGGDFMLFGLIAILTAVVVRSIYITKARLKREDNKLTIIMAIAAVLIVLPKGVFPGICLLPLIIFYGGISHRKLRKALIITSAIVVGLAWQKFGINMHLTNPGPANSLSDFPGSFIRTMLTRWVDTDFVYKGDNVGNIPVASEHLGMPSLIVTVIDILFAIYLFVGYPEKLKLQISNKQALALKCTAAVCALAVIGGSFAALFVGASYMQSGGTITGVQTRYLYPAFFMLPLIPLTRRINIDSEKTMASIVIIGSAVCLSFLVLISLIGNHWLNILGIS